MLAASLLAAGPALAAPAFSCGSFAMMGGAQLICSHIDPTAPTQSCTFMWTLMGPSGQTVVSGAFLLPPGVSNSTVYQGNGFSYALASPIVLCQARRSDP